MKRNLLLLAVALLSLWACKNETASQQNGAPPATNAEDFTIVPGQRVGKISAAACSMKDILAAYGSDAKADSVHFAEGLMTPGVILYSGTKNELTIGWEMEIDNIKPVFFRVIGDSSAWKTDSGIKIGTSMEEVVRLNGKDFDLSGFGWDYGGLVTDWKGGAFTDNLFLGFYAAQVSEEFVGEKTISSADLKLREEKPVVGRIETRL